MCTECAVDMFACTYVYMHFCVHMCAYMCVCLLVCVCVCGFRRVSCIVCVFMMWEHVCVFVFVHLQWGGGCKSM